MKAFIYFHFASMISTTQNTKPLPRLAAPGAGLPKPELWIARARFRVFRWRNDRAACAALFAAERDKVIELARSVEAKIATQPVLIKRLRGLEDSSRNWSICMTVEHLQIVNAEVFDAIQTLVSGSIPEQAVSTATVKPNEGVGIEIIDTFSSNCEAQLRQVEAISDLRTSLRYAHPWFGPLDASDWLALVAFHQRLHRTQIERILSTL